MLETMQMPVLLADEEPKLSEQGFQEGLRGVHTSRTIMFAELDVVMGAVPAPRRPSTVREAIAHDNIIGKATRSGRVTTATKLVNLYSFDPGNVLYAGFETLWSRTSYSHPVLAILLATGRDAVLRSTAEVICNVPIGEVVLKESMYRGLLNGFASKYAENTLRSISRNCLASWKQSGHLVGKKRAIRSKAPSDYVAVSYAVLLSLLRGLQGQDILKSIWIRILDMSPAELESALQEASRHGLITFRRVGDVVEITLGPQLLEVFG